MPSKLSAKTGSSTSMAPTSHELGAGHLFGTAQ
jgi:hypothetical protein